MPVNKDTQYTEEETASLEEMTKQQGFIGVFLFGGLLVIRVLGLAQLFNYPHPGNPLYVITWLREAGLFVFFDAILLAIPGFICGLYLVSRNYATYSVDNETLKKMDTTAVFIIGGICLIYIAGSLFIIIG